MEKSYKYRFDRRTIYWTLVYLVIFLLLGVLLYQLYEGGYLSAWFTSFVVALVALMSLSIPRRIVVGDEKVEVRCLLDITELRRDEIASVRRVDEREMKWLLPYFGGCGFFGYYGHFFDLKRFERVRIYASEWKNFVEITDIYEERLYVSCSDADELVARLAPWGGDPMQTRDGASSSDADELVSRLAPSGGDPMQTRDGASSSDADELVARLAPSGGDPAEKRDGASSSDADELVARLAPWGGDPMQTRDGASSSEADEA